MSEIEQVEKNANPYARQILVSGALLVILVMLVYYTPSWQAWRIAAAYLLPLGVAYGVGLAVLILRKGVHPVPTGLFALGSLFVIGGAALDGVATLLKTPNLASEANPIARALLDSGHSLTFVLAYGLLAQAGWLIFICTLWAAFLRHQATLLLLARSKQVRSGLEFIKAATGGAHLSWRQYLLPLKRAELPTSYYVLWPLTAVLVGGSLYRWYLGFTWLELISWDRNIVLAISTGLPITGYFIWLWQAYNKELRPAKSLVAPE
ncbi:MAG: hypothetical protein L0332_28135 [Chloroflexi bacterium]|nr:hypothetical protein [Chloroflexota bacterium]MCI0576980.1 hypothetical protein [Chloroflexota bacterium]MCI0647310.1 hypothetical protein [Chloroflexota bacterium]MCI0730570.1 hypothetical protein [Chloroflexota bacterium]